MERIERLRELMKKREIDVLALAPGSTLRYLTGHEFSSFERLFLLLIPAEGTPAVVLPKFDEGIWRGLVKFEARLFGWEDTEGPGRATDEAVATLERRGRIGVETLVLRFMEYQRLAEHMPGSEIVSADPIARDLRLVKDRDEVASIRRAARIAEEALEETLAGVRVGSTEREIAGRLCSLMLEKGGEGISFGPIVLTGPKSALPHGVPGDRAAGSGELLLIDFGTSYHGYHCDITRTFVVGAEPDDRTREVYEAVREGSAAGCAAAGPGVAALEVHRAAHKKLNEPRFDEFFKHRTGHGLGLDIHEPPSVMEGNAEPLEAGMVITVEPGLYLEGWGGVRIEEDVLITSDGSETLTRFPRELRIVGR